MKHIDIRRCLPHNIHCGKGLLTLISTSGDVSHSARLLLSVISKKFIHPHIPTKDSKEYSRRNLASLISQSGQALVETSFVIFMFFAFIFFTLHLTLLSNAKSTLNLATYSACRECIVTKGSKSKVGAAAEAFLNAIWKDLDAKQGYYKIKYDSSPSHLAFGDKVKLTMTIYYKPMPIPLMKQFYHLTSTKSIALTSSCGMTME